MLGIFKQKPQQPPPERPPTFIEQLIDSALKRASPDSQLAALAVLWTQIRELEDEYSVRCRELDILRDEFADAFEICTNPDVVFVAAQSTDLFSSIDFGFRHDPEYEALPPRLQLRLAKLHVRSHLDGLERHPSEYKPQLQHAFEAVESRGLDEFETKDALRKEFGVTAWESVREMNPHVIFQIPRPRAPRGA